MNNMDLLYLKAVRQAGELATTLRQLETEVREVGTTDTAENVSSILVDAEDVREALKENPVVLADGHYQIAALRLDKAIEADKARGGK